MKASTIAFSSRLNSYLGEGNTFHSPFSIQVALGMANAGAKGETSKSLSKTICCPESKKDQDEYFSNLVSSIGNTEDYQLVTHNALWAQDGYKFNPEYSETVTNTYKGNFTVVDYINKPKEAVNLINESCNKVTQGKIPTIISDDFVSSQTRLVLTNAIYFKGQWESGFKAENTTDRDFTVDNKTNKVPMMQQKSNFQYFENDQFQALSLRYKGKRLSMLVVLPKSNSTKEIDENLEAVYNEAVEGLVTEEVNVSLPRFKMETKYKMGEMLKEMGASIAFSDDANFTGISKERLKISEVIHKAFVEVNEEGTEAAAATAVGMIRCTSFVRPKPPKEFNANHPFVFFIRDHVNNTVLFAGRVCKP